MGRTGFKPPQFNQPPTIGSEAQLQAQVFQWAWNTLPATRRLLIHVPNGGSRNKAEALQLRAQGVVAGVHDLLFYWSGQLYWFELKVGSNVQSKEQITFAQAMVEQGAICHEIRTFEQFQEVVQTIISGQKVKLTA